METQQTQITIRRAADFGSRLAVEMAEKLYNDNIDVFKWPEKLPITIKRIMQLPEINKDTKVAKRAIEAARLVWHEIRHEAITTQAFLLAHGEGHEHAETYTRPWCELSMELEQAAGKIFYTDHLNEDVAKKYVYEMLKPMQLKQFIREFSADYKNFIDEIREIIRAKKTIKASTRFELICMLNTNTQSARTKRLKKTKR